ncbi:hypothetical protein CAPTEDRAFT_225629 [Capitella teleta]|uniref:Glycosyltransferase 61 catalytic domain-containing protein n=1 Tax=Capitella teleta TaxID=283909 RepID=R7U509_CAPTE|nr:hypothetical protein CAPTEDRAFT_225629 [Capitella teleta]|eukprot:ELU01420.1 hypothetical protein CAPTEDRAFT_225629 [Capitella teleta]
MSLVKWLRRKVGYAAVVVITLLVALRLFLFNDPLPVKQIRLPLNKHQLSTDHARNGITPSLRQRGGYLEPNDGNRFLFKGDRIENDPLEVRPNLKAPSLKFTNDEAPKVKLGWIDPMSSRKVVYSNNSVLIFDRWKRYKKDLCDGKLIAYDKEFAVLFNAVIDRTLCVSPKKGGEFLEDVRMQKEDVEYYTFKKGAFQVQCSLTVGQTYHFNRQNHLNRYMSALIAGTETVTPLTAGFTIAVTRYEYANLYHTMTDWYNAFLLMQFFNKAAAETNILIVDAHPRGVLDPVWPVLFNSTRRLSRIAEKTSYESLVWGVQGYNSPLLNHMSSKPLPLSEEFRAFFLSSYGIPPTASLLNCSSLRVLFLWRRDYVAHPRRPDGHVVRKIHNEREILNHLQSKYQQLRVAGVQIDKFEMVDQLRQIASTDILVGMHGAGLTHALFLPRHAALVELFPLYWSSINAHFKSIAAWRNLTYTSWENRDQSLEKANHFTHVPVGIADTLIKNAYKGVCHRDLK